MSTLPHEQHEPHDPGLGNRLNWLRAGVLGANDGIVSTAGLVIGVAGATTATATLLTAGVAGLVSGALSMGVGEYVSVSTQRDGEQAMLAKERRELAEIPEAELAELAGFYEAKGLEPGLAQEVARQLTAHDALRAHAEVELGIDPDELTEPRGAALASAASFAVGALVPLLAILLLPAPVRVVGTVLAVVLALALTGLVSARLGSSSAARGTWRNILGGLLAMAVTFAVGRVVGHGA